MRLRRVLVRFGPSTAGDAGSAGASEGAVIVRESFLGGVKGFEDECLRWCRVGGAGRLVLPIKPCEEALAEHDRHVHAFRRATSFHDVDSMPTREVAFVKRRYRETDRGVVEVS